MTDIMPEWVKKLEPSAIQQALQGTQNSDVISFSLGMPSESLFPILDYKKSMSNLWMPNSLQYAPPLYNLKCQIVELMIQRGVSCTPDQILLTNGAQQAIYLLCKVLAGKNNTAIVDAATYPGFIQTSKLLGINLSVLPAECYHDDYYTRSLETLCKNTNKPKFFYTMSDGHNPLGTSLTKEKRLKITEIAHTYQIPIIEDDAYGFLNYEPIELPLKAYNSDWVFSIGSFSKILAPSARVGWIIAPEPLIAKLEIIKESSDINTATFSQRILSRYIDDNNFEKRLLYIRDIYKEKRNKMVYSLKKHIPELLFTFPTSGFMIWGRLPTSIDANKLFWHALKSEKISFLPGTAFGSSSNEDLNHCLRLSFSYCPLELIEIGIERLARAIKTYHCREHLGVL
jgi:2-aminoadipate transaminase